MKASSSLFVICICTTMSSFVNGASLMLTSSATLNINEHYVVEGVHIFGSFRSIDSALFEALILSSSGRPDDIYHAATIDLTPDINRLSFAFDINFDATAPDLATISASILAATSDFVISLPLLSSLSGFFELVDLGNTSFHTTMPTLAAFATQSSIDGW